MMRKRRLVMLKKLMLVLSMFSLAGYGAVVVEQKQSGKKTSLSETELRTFAKAVPDVKNAGRLYIQTFLSYLCIDHPRARH